MGAAVVVVVGCGGVVVVVVGLGSGGQGHVARSGWVGPLVQPSQLGHVTRGGTHLVECDDVVLVQLTRSRLHSQL